MISFQVCVAILSGSEVMLIDAIEYQQYQEASVSDGEEAYEGEEGLEDEALEQ